MSPEQTVLLRHVILRQLASAAPVALPLDTLAQGVRIAGFRPTDLMPHLAALEEKTWLTPLPSPAHNGHRRFRLTAAGRDYLEAQGLA